MVCVILRTDHEGFLTSVDVSGHAGSSEAGRDIVCASITTLVRSAARLFERDGRFLIDGAADAPGHLYFAVRRRDDFGLEYLRGVGDFVVLGVADVVSEFPKRCTMKIIQGGN